MLPELKKHDCVVINLENFADGNGTHWTCAYRNEYFDSFGLPPPDVIEEKLRKLYPNLLYNSSQLQMDSSILCGYYCVYYIKERSKGREALDVLLDFTQEPSEHNEKIIV